MKAARHIQILLIGACLISQSVADNGINLTSKIKHQTTERLVAGRQKVEGKKNVAGKQRFVK